MSQSCVRSIAGGARRLLSGLAVGSVVAAGLTVVPASGAAADVAGGPVVLDGFRAVCWSAEEDWGGMTDPGPMVNYTKKIVAGVYADASPEHDGTIAVLGVSASTSICGQTVGAIAANVLHPITATPTYYPAASDVEDFLADLADGDVDPAFVWLPDSAVDVGDALAADAEALQAYVTAGGGLLTHQNSYSWLDEFAPGIVVSAKAITTNGDENVTAAAATAFGLVENDVPFGSEQAFSGDLGALVPYIVHVSNLNSTIGGYLSFAPATTAPDAPALSQVVAGNGTLTVTLAPPTVDGGSPITEYVVVAQPGGQQAVLTGAQGGAVTVTGLANGTSHTLTATAVNAVGSSAASAPVSGTPYTVAAKPAAAKLAGRTLDSLTLNVAAPRNDGGSPIRHFVVTVKGAGLTRSVRVGAAGGRVTVRGLVPGTTYRVTVAAVNRAGRSSVTAKSVSTQAAPTKAQPVNVVKTKLHPGMTATLSGSGLFRYGSAALTPTGRAQVATMAKKLTTAKVIRCLGHTDGKSSRANRALGLARAEQLCKALAARGVTAQATAVSLGAKQQVRSGGNRKSRAANRRAEVTVVR